ncbi:hypothetical protein GCM10017562_10170 [Streptomyces roseofulvus]
MTPARPWSVPSKDSLATYVPVPVDWSDAAVNKVTERPTTSPPYRFSSVATPTGSAVGVVGREAAPE